MKLFIRNMIMITGLCLSLGLHQSAFAEEGPLEKEESASQEMKDHPKWEEHLKAKYSLTDEQINQMKDQGFNYPHMAMSAQLADKAGKPLDEIIRMRAEQKMGWGKIAKELGVPPKEIGQSVAAMRHAVKAQKREEKMARRQEKAAARAEKKNQKMSH